jgi:hypothetical protein
MKDILQRNRICKVCALVVATLILPALTHAEDRDGRDQNNEHRWGEKDEHRWGDHATARDREKVSPVPDGGSGIVLLTAAVGAILVFSARLSSRKVA